MANLTISIDEEVLKQARLRALQQGVSVNALLREYLIRYAGVKNAQAKAVESFLRIGKRSKAGSGGKRTWTRDDLHER